MKKRETFLKLEVSVSRPNSLMHINAEMFNKVLYKINSNKVKNKVLIELILLEQV